MSRRAAAIGLLALALTYLVLTHTVVAYLAGKRPEAALRLDPSNPDALIAIAERRLAAPADAGVTHRAPEQRPAGYSPIGTFANPALNRVFALRLGTPESTERSTPAAASRDATVEHRPDLPAIRATLETAIAQAPLSSRAFRLLGQVSEQLGDEARATHLTRRAAALSLHDSAAQARMMLRAFAEQDYEQALVNADILLRTRPESQTLVVPLLTQLAEQSETSALVQRRLAEQPPWRHILLTTMMGSMTDARTPLTLLMALKATGVPPTTAEIATYLRFLIDQNFHELAYYTWLQFLPAEELRSARLVYNGGFEKVPSGLPFDWTITQGIGVSVDLALRPDAESNRALRIEFGAGRVHLGQVSQRLMLAPGPHALRFNFRGDVSGRRGLKWVLACAAGAPMHLAETPMFIGQQRTWRPSELEFTVPDEGCRSQELRLVHDSRSASEEFVSGTAWYDDVTIVRIDVAPLAR